MKLEILTDAVVLRNVSQPVDGQPNLKHLTDLLESLPDDALGLAAPQIGVFERMFVANLSCGRYLFVNPSLEDKSVATFVSKEGCLSLPGKVCFLRRHLSVTLVAESAQKIGVDNQIETIYPVRMELSGQDAAIVQHETDHLDGILITNHPQAELQEAEVLDRIKARQARIQQKRAKNKAKSKHISQHISNPKRIAQLEKQQRAFNRRQRNQMRIEEELRAQEQGIGVSLPPNSETSAD